MTVLLESPLITATSYLQYVGSLVRNPPVSLAIGHSSQSPSSVISVYLKNSACDAFANFKTATPFFPLFTGLVTSSTFCSGNRLSAILYSWEQCVFSAGWCSKLKPIVTSISQVSASQVSILKKKTPGHEAPCADVTSGIFSELMLYSEILICASALANNVSCRKVLYIWFVKAQKLIT